MLLNINLGWWRTLCLHVILLITLFTISFDPVSCFNVDTHNYVTHRGNPNSMFGFSVALHRENSNSWLIVGAPTAQTLQPGVEKGGAVYKCDIARPDACTLIEFDIKGNMNESTGKQVDVKSHQWFGATVRSSGEDGIVLACAPRYMWFTTHHALRQDPVGTCYVARNQFTEFSEYSPCRTRNWGYHRQGSCQAGLGASVSKDGSRLYIGAVGSWYWQGQLHSIDAYARLQFLPPRLTIIEEGQVISQSTHARPDVISTSEGPQSEDDSYMGYSVAVGDFGGGSGGFNDVAVGLPRGAGLVGKVVLYSWNMTNLKNFTGEQLGAYFAYSLASGDLDGDGTDDIIVGAPLYTDLNDNKGYYETGRVYILYQGKGDYRWNGIHVRDGINSKSRFGLSLAYLGDLNLDGYGDFAVGAPYDGPKERGAVYIFLGSKLGAREKASQIIYSEQVAGQPNTFGFSLAGGLDLDENLYPDLLVGAYDSETAVFLRTRPVVRVDASLTFALPSKQISLEEKNCTLRDRTKVPCVELNTCLNYTGVNVDRRLEFEIQFILDSKKPNDPRMFFQSEENRNIMNQTIRLDKNNQFCKKTFVYIKPNIKDKLTSFEAVMKYGLKGSEISTTRRLQPVLDQAHQEELSKRDSIIIQKNCGKDNICIPDLRLIATPNVNRYLLGSGERLEIDVVVQNEGEDAFEAIYELQVPSGLNYVKVEKVESAGKELLPILCSAPSYLNNNTLHCDIGNPLPREKIVHFKVVLQPYRVDGLKPRYEFSMFVNSTNPEDSKSLSDNQMHFKVPIWVETDLILQGSSQPSDVHYNVSQYENAEEITQESQIGPQVTHIYSIRNKGPSDILEAEAYFLWPSFTLAGDHLFYLLEQPEVTGNVKCELVEDVNIAKIYMEKKKKGSYDGAVSSSLTGSDHSSHSSGSSSSSSSSSGSTTHTSSSSSSSLGGSWKSQGSLTAEERRRLEEAQRKKEGSVSSSSHWESHHSNNRGSIGSDSHLGRGEGGQSNTQVGSGSGGSRFETTRTEHGSSWSSRGSSSAIGSNRNVGYDANSDGNRGSSGTVDLNKEIILDTRGSRIGGNNDGLTVDVAGTRISTETVHGSHRTPSSYPVDSNERWRDSGYRGTVGVGSSRDQNKQSGSDSTHFEERHFEKNTTWSSADKKPLVSTSWSVNKDGVTERGSYQGEGSRAQIDNTDESYFGHREKNFNDTWMVTDSNRHRGTSGSNEGRYDRVYDRPIGARNFSEERSTVRNTTWTSRGGPAVTSVNSSWSVNRDGIARNGSQSRVFHEKEGYGRDKSESSYDSSREGFDPNSIRGAGSGSKIYSEEHEVHRNTTWSSADGKPITEERRHWNINQDGIESSGSTSRTYEGSIDRDQVLSSRGGGSSRTHASGSGISSEDHRSHGQGSRVSSHEDSSRDRIYTSHGTSDSSERRGHHESEGASGEERSSDVDYSRRTSGGSATWGRTATNTNIGDLLNNRRTSHGFGGFGDAALGPRDGEARTYTLDLGVMNSGSRNAENERIGDHRLEGSSSGRGSYSSGERHSSNSGERLGGSSSGSRHYEFESSSGSSGRGSSSSGERRGGGYSSSGSRHYEFESSSSGAERVGSQKDLDHRGSGEHSSGGYSSGGSRRYEQGSSSGGSSGSRSSGSVRTESRYSSSRSGGFSAASNEDDGGYTSGSRSYERSSSSSSRPSSSGRSRSWSYSSTSGTADGDSALHGGMYSNREERSSSSHSSHYGPRHRRQVDDVEDFDTSLECSTTKCTRVRCTVGLLKKDEETIIKFKSRVWVQTLKKLAGWNQVNVSSMLVARVSRLPHIGRPDVVTTKNLEVLTQLVPRHPPAKPEVVPLWIIVLSACAGAILLMLLVFILYKLGFFKRNRPSTSPEKQPLNRNGHYQPGDEAL